MIALIKALVGYAGARVCPPKIRYCEIGHRTTDRAWKHCHARDRLGRTCGAAMRKGER